MFVNVFLHYPSKWQVSAGLRFLIPYLFAITIKSLYGQFRPIFQVSCTKTMSTALQRRCIEFIFQVTGFLLKECVLPIPNSHFCLSRVLVVSKILAFGYFLITSARQGSNFFLKFGSRSAMLVFLFGSIIL